MRRPSPALTLLTLPAAVVGGPVLGLAFTIRNLGAAAKGGLRPALIGVLNLPFDAVSNTLGFFATLGLYPAFAGTAESPAIGRRQGSLIFLGGPLGAGVSTFAAAFTPTSTIFISRKEWDRGSPAYRHRLVNHELWHARQQFLRYSGWLFWPAYLVSNFTHGVHRKNPFESGRNGAYANVDDCWDEFSCSDVCVGIENLFAKWR